jgi:hypothetical protein
MKAAVKAFFGNYRFFYCKKSFTRVPNTERKSKHHPEDNPLGSEYSKNSVWKVELPKLLILEQ